MKYNIKVINKGLTIIIVAMTGMYIGKIYSDYENKPIYKSQENESKIINSIYLKSKGEKIK